VDIGRLIIDGPADGAWNMAADEAILESAAKNQASTLRFYAWNEPTLSLGYFQKLEDRQVHSASRNCPIVRRASGGGAIVHDRELTYSFCTPVKDRVASDLFALYRIFHETMVQVLESLGVSASMFSSEKAAHRDDAFLCFQRRTEGDVLVGGWKIAGSAQRRHKGAVLQHGGVLLAASRSAPELPGISELCFEIDSAKLIEEWTRQLSVRLATKFHEGQLTATETADATVICRTRFRDNRWTERR
jgi:lipoate-protein ligase A